MVIYKNVLVLINDRIVSLKIEKRGSRCLVNGQRAEFTSEPTLLVFETDTQTFRISAEQQGLPASIAEMYTHIVNNIPA